MNSLSYRRWLIGVVLAVCVVLAPLLTVVIRLDIYGLFRDPRGRRLPIYLNERASKYLLNQRYVPANFDSLLIGSSTTSNWEVSTIENLRVYNNSVDGGDAPEERLLLAQGEGKGRYKVALVLLHPYFTCMHTINDPDMSPKGWRSALGSFNLLLTYREMYRVKKLHLDPLVFWDGHKTLIEPAVLPTQKALAYIYQVDPTALEDYRALLQQLRGAGTKVIFVIPPMYEPLLEINRPLLDSYRQQIQVEQPGDRVIDFNGDAFAAIRRDRSNFSDGVHSTTRGAAIIVKALNSCLAAMLSADASQMSSMRRQ